MFLSKVAGLYLYCDMRYKIGERTMPEKQIENTLFIATKARLELCRYITNSLLARSTT